MTDAQTVLDRFAALDAEAGPWLSIWRRLAERFDPSHPIRGAARGDMTAIFDNAGIEAKQIFTSAAISLMTPRGQRWHNLQPANEALKDNPRVRRYGDEMTRLLFRLRYDDQAGFQTANELYWASIGVYGLGVTLIEEVVDRKPGDRKPPFRYRPIPVHEVRASKSVTGVYDTLYRAVDFTARQAMQLFGDGVGKEIRDAAEDPARREEKFAFVHAVEPNDGAAADIFDYQSVWLDRASEKIVRRGGFYEFPYMIGDINPAGDLTPYGVSPAMIAAPDLAQLFAAHRTTARAWEMSVAPPMATTERLSRALELGPAMINEGLIDPETGQSKVKPLLSGANPSVGEAMIARKTAQVRAPFFAQFWQIMTDKPGMSATEAYLRAQEKSDLIGPPFARHEEVLSRAVRRELAILERQGQEGYIRLPPRPPQMDEVIFEFQNPLARLRKAGDAAGVMRTFEFISAAGSIDPKVLKRFDLDQMAQIIADAEGLPERAKKDDATVAQSLAAEQQALAEAQANAARESAALQESERAKSFAPLLTAITKMNEARAD
ncbi:MAG: portal protein [Alphaproteobacteria bacterium]|nr:portal protein [Alphaproteobacteria bacterium]